MLWQRDDLLKTLKTKSESAGWTQWALLEMEEDRQEFYLIQSKTDRVDLDQSREVHNQVYRLRVYINKEDGRQGTAETPLFPKLDLQTQLNELEKKAHLGAEKSWQFPKQWETATAQPQKIYPPLVEDLAGCAFQIYKDLEKAVRACDQGEFNSAELFVIKDKKRRTLSTGFSSEEVGSRIYSEVCFSNTDPSNQLSEEFMVTRWAAHPEQLDFARMCRESAEFAAASLKTQKPKMGEYDVILHADVLNTLFHDVFSQLNARQKYYKLPFMEKGAEFIPGFKGVPFKLNLEPLRDFCFGSGSYSGDGCLQQNMTLAKGNTIQENPTSSQMSQYLELPTTTVIGSLVVEPESCLDIAELRKSRPKVLEILQFSGLFSNEMDLTYSSEIRLARLYDNETGEETFIKGGNLSGHFPTNFASVTWGGNQIEDNGEGYSGGGTSYVGPECALVGSVSVSS